MNKPIIFTGIIIASLSGLLITGLSSPEQGVLEFESTNKYINARDNLMQKSENEELTYDEFVLLIKIYDYELKKIGNIKMSNIENKNQVKAKLESKIKKKGTQFQAPL